MFQVKWHVFLQASVVSLACFALLLSGCGDKGGEYFYDFADPIIVNVSEGGGKGYLKVDLTLQLDSDKAVKSAGEKAAVLRNVVNQYLTSQGPALKELSQEIEKLGEKLKDEIKDKAGVEVQKVLFRNYVWQ